jgi:hypothetical protein
MHLQRPSLIDSYFGRRRERAETALWRASRRQPGLLLVRFFMGQNVSPRGTRVGWPVVGLVLVVAVAVARHLVLGPGLTF